MDCGQYMLLFARWLDLRRLYPTLGRPEFLRRGTWEECQDEYYKAILGLPHES